MTTTDVSDEELLAFTAQFADGECLCAEIDPSDRPCLTCAGKEAARERQLAKGWTAAIAEAQHGPDKCGYTADQTFTCPRCERTVCWCEGAYDDTPALCNDCANEIYKLFEEPT